MTLTNRFSSVSKVSTLAFSVIQSTSLLVVLVNGAVLVVAAAFFIAAASHDAPFVAICTPAKAVVTCVSVRVKDSDTDAVAVVMTCDKDW